MQVILVSKLRSVDHAFAPWALVGDAVNRIHRRSSRDGLATLAQSSRLRKYPLADVTLSHPLAVQFTPEQMAWLDSRCVAGLSRSAVIRIVIEESMRLHRDGILPATAQLQKP